jgi:hypothetical protein
MLCRQPGTRLWLSWSLATAAGAVGGVIFAVALGLLVISRQGFLGFAVGAGSRSVGLFEQELYFLAWVLAGTLAGIGQWLILRRRISNIDRRAWILATSVGYLLSEVTMLAGSFMVGITWFLISEMTWIVNVWILGRNKTWGESAGLALAPVVWALLAATAVASWAVIGVAQWLVLKRYVQRSRQWIYANAAVGVIGQLILLLVIIGFVPEAIPSDTIPYPYDVSFLVSVIMFFIGGLITGLTLLRLLRQPLQA